LNTSLLIANRIKYKNAVTYYELTALLPRTNRSRIKTILNTLLKKKLIQKKDGLFKGKYRTYYVWIGG
jgi:hypothetical protein